jgi:amino acid adenylation domain-containing protein
MPERTLDSFQISPQQERVWAAEPQGPAARTQALLSIRGQVDASALAEALRLVAGRHESLRTTFERQPGLTLPLQVVNPLLDPQIQTLDISAAEPGERVRQLDAVLRAELHAPFDFERGPLVRATFVIEDSDAVAVVLTLSALCSDQVSASLLLRELSCHLASAEVVEDPLQYADFSAWQHELSDSDEEEARAACAFWRELGDISSPVLPFTGAGAGDAVEEHVGIEIDDALARALADQARNYGTSVAAFAQAAWHAVLGRFAATETATVAFVPGGRRHPDLAGALGAFSRPVPVQTRVDPARSFAEVLADVERARGDALVRQDYAPAGGLGAVEIGFVEYPWDLHQPEGLRLSIQRMTPSGPDLRLVATCAMQEHGLALGICFDPARYRRETVGGLAGGLVQILRAAAHSPSVPLSEVELLGERERERVLREFNDTAAAVPAECVHEAVARWALAAPGRSAVVEGERSIAYAELDARANQLAHRLRARGVAAGAAVGLCTDRSIEMVVGLLGILKAGAAYVPLHHEHPPARLRHQLATTGASVVVTQEGLLERLANFDGEVVCLDRDRDALACEPDSAPAGGASREDLAYVIYTSGSTGTPKGVSVTHGNLANYTAHIVAALDAGREPLSFALVSSISTDLGNTSVFGALCSGGTLVLVGPDVAADPGGLANLMQTTPVDVLKITPSHIGALLAASDARVLPRRWLVVGGERASWDLIEQVRTLSNCAILNHYGPTETTVGSCTYVLGEGPGEYGPASVPIGRPISNTRCYVLDDARRLVPVGVAGGLFVAGAGVARGYAGAPELTAERFSADPFASGGEGRMYDTGDLARWLPDGTLEFLGRADEQIKLRGYRVEPAEIETVLRSHPQVREAVTVTQASAGGAPRLVAYCTVEGALEQDGLRAHLAEWLPEFMLPGAIAIVDEMPRTPSGKIDKQRLPDPELAGAQSDEYLAPRTPLEEAVAAIWQQVLGVAQVGVQDDFFALGGHSLLATQVVAQVRSDFAVDLPLHSLFTCPTVASLAAEIVEMMGDSEGEETARLMAELEGMSDQEAQRLLAEDLSTGAGPP